MKRFLQVGMLLVLLQALHSFFKGFSPSYEATAVSSMATPLIVAIFPFWHGVLRYGWRKMLVFFLIVSVTGWCYESLSIATGFPFGNYHYTDLLSGWIGQVPFVIMPSYFAFGYLAWTIGHILISKRDNRVTGNELLILPVTAAFVMVLWDVTMDPVHSTITGYWSWHDGGSYFGVPVSNYLGWFLCVISFYFAFAFLNRGNATEPAQESVANPRYWQLPVLMYGAIILEYVGGWLGRESVQIASADGHQWWTGDVYGAMLTVSLFSVVPLVLYCFYRISRDFSETRA